jgi:hypothetical protein
MPDTKKGRERTGLNKRAQLEADLAERDREWRNEPGQSPLDVPIEELAEGAD